jgi:diguanylate cyclase (GGDEF)-like protein
MTQTKLPVVMLVDDEIAVLDALERDLRGQFQCIKCQSFEQAKQQLRAHPEIRILVTDEFLTRPSSSPTKNNADSARSGNDLLRWAQLHRPLIVRCLISGKMETEQITQALGQGLYHRFFFKPWEPKLLQLQLRECLVMADLLRESKLDPLTGLLNRRGFEEQLTRELERCVRHHRSLSIIVWDLDHFKAINDKKGHEAGDHCLREFARNLSSGLRNIDYVSRLGGDEFAIILPDTILTFATQIAERIHANVKANGQWTASAGVTQLLTENDDMASLLKRADQLLYRAKENGRDRVEVQD